MQNDSPIPMADDQDENKQPQSNAIELHDTGLENVYSVIKKQQARDIKRRLREIELEKTDYESDNTIEYYNKIKKMFAGEKILFDYVFECYYDAIPVPVFSNRICELLNPIYETDLAKWQILGVNDNFAIVGIGEKKWPLFMDFSSTQANEPLLFEHKNGFDIVFINLSKIEKICFAAAQKIAYGIINCLKDAGY
jgi:hypothetical protein